MISLITPARALEKLGGNIRERRVAMGFTQAGLSARSGVPLGTLRKFERTGLGSTEALVKLLSIVGGLEATIEAASEHPNVVGVKDSSGSFEEMERLIETFRDRPEFTLHVGSELLLDRAVRRGAHGGVCGGANVFPRLYVELYEASRDGNFARAQ